MSNNTKASFTGLLSLAIALIAAGLGLIQQHSNIPYAVVMIVAGVALIYLAVYLLEKGLIPPQQKQ